MRMQGEKKGDEGAFFFGGGAVAGGGMLHRIHISLALSEFTGCAKLFS